MPDVTPTSATSRMGLSQTLWLHLDQLLFSLEHFSPDAIIKRAEEEISHYDSKNQSSAAYARGKNRFHPYERADKKFEGRSDSKQERPAWKNIGRRQFRRGRGKNANFSTRPAKGQQSYK